VGYADLLIKSLQTREKMLAIVGAINIYSRILIQEAFIKVTHLKP